MKLYIWNNEYEVLLSIADSVEEARELILKESKKNYDEYCKLWNKFKKIKTMENSSEIFKQYTAEDRAYIEDESKEKVDSIYSEKYHLLHDNPDLVFDLKKQGYIFYHGNE